MRLPDPFAWMRRRRHRLYSWHRIFAFLPHRVESGEIRWLCFLERRGYSHAVDGFGEYWTWETIGCRSEIRRNRPV